MFWRRAAVYWLAGAGILYTLALFWPRSNVGASPDSRQQARTLLQTCLAAQRIMDNVEYHAATTCTFSRPVEPDPTVGLVVYNSVLFRRQHKALDILVKRKCLDKEHAAKEPPQRARVIVNPKHFAHLSQKEDEKKQLGPRASKKNKEKYWQQYIETPEQGAFLDGFVYGCGGKRLAEILLDEGEAVMRGDEIVDNVRCAVIAGKSRYGQITLWLDREHQCIPLKCICEKGTDDFHYDRNQDLTRISEQPVIQFYRVTPLKLIGVSTVADHIVLKMIDGHYIPIQGHSVMKQLFPSGKVSMDAYTTERSDIHLSPSFEGTDAFELDVPDNSMVTDADDRSGVTYVWKNGDFRPAQPEELRQLAADFMSRHRSPWSMFQTSAWSVGGVLLLLLSAWIAYRRIRIRKGA